MKILWWPRLTFFVKSFSLLYISQKTFYKFINKMTFFHCSPSVCMVTRKVKVTTMVVKMKPWNRTVLCGKVWSFWPVFFRFSHLKYSCTRLVDIPIHMDQMVWHLWYVFCCDWLFYIYIFHHLLRVLQMTMLKNPTQPLLRFGV